MQVSPGRLLVLVLFVAAFNLQGEPQVALQAPAGAVVGTLLAALTTSKAVPSLEGWGLATQMAAAKVQNAC